MKKHMQEICLFLSTTWHSTVLQIGFLRSRQRAEMTRRVFGTLTALSRGQFLFYLLFIFKWSRMFCFKCNPYTRNTFSLEGMALWLGAGLSDPVSSSPFVPWLMIDACILNHWEPITNVNGATSAHRSRVRTPIASTSEAGTKRAESVRGCWMLELAAGCVERSRGELRC